MRARVGLGNLGRAAASTDGTAHIICLSPGMREGSDGSGGVFVSRALCEVDSEPIAPPLTKQSITRSRD